MGVRDNFGVYVIKDNGAGDASLPFFALSSQVAVRQFATAVRTCPPSMRPDMELVAIGHYDHSNFKLEDALEVSICLGSDDEIIKMVENDKKFYERVSVDQLPVEGGEK